jgi:hypothetical protein
MRPKKTGKPFLLCIYALTILGCSKEPINPSGEKISELRNTGSFTGVDIAGSSSVHIRYGSDFKVELKGSNNLVSNFSAKVENNVLLLKYNDINVGSDDLDVYITMPGISSLSLSGSASFDLSGNFPPQESLATFISGSGNINFHGELTVNTLKGEIEGSGSSALEMINAKNADLRIAGSGDFKATVSDHLKAKITGSGNIHYFGSPVLVTDISGSGKVIKR